MHILSTLLPSCSSSTSTRWRFPELVLPHVWDIVLVVVHDLHAHLDVPVHQTHHSKVVVVVAEGVVKMRGHVQPEIRFVTAVTAAGRV